MLVEGGVDPRMVGFMRNVTVTWINLAAAENVLMIELYGMSLFVACVNIGWKTILSLLYAYQSAPDELRGSRWQIGWRRSQG